MTNTVLTVLNLGYPLTLNIVASTSLSITKEIGKRIGITVSAIISYVRAYFFAGIHLSRTEDTMVIPSRFEKQHVAGNLEEQRVPSHHETMKPR